MVLLKFFWRYVGESGQRADPPPPVCPGDSIRRRAVVSCYRYIVVPIRAVVSCYRYIVVPIRSIRRIVLSLYRCSHPVDTSIRRYVDTSIRRYVDTALRRYGVTALRRYGVTALRRYALLHVERRYGVTALRRYGVLSFSILRKIISQKHGPLFKIGTRGDISAADPSRRAAGPPGRRAVVTS